MDKLQKVNKLLELLQNDTLTPKDVGTAGTTGTVAHVVTFVYGWE